MFKRKLFLFLMIGFFSFSQSADAAKKYERITLPDGKLLELSVRDLSSNEGYLILEITPSFIIKRLEVSKVAGLGPKFVLKDVDEKSVHIIKLKQGNYYFSRIKLPSRMYFPLNEDFQFSVEAGVINYPGEFLMERGSSFWTASLILKNRLFRFIDIYGDYLKTQYPGYLIKYNGAYLDKTAEEFSLCCE